MKTIHERLRSLSVLIAEDDSSTRKWLVRVLSIYFKKVHGVADALEALEYFTHSPTDIVIADIQMPDVDGLVFLQKIAFYASDTLRVVMTAFNTEPYLNRAVDMGVHFYLKKPIDIDELLFAIASRFPLEEPQNGIIDLGERFLYNQQEMSIYHEKDRIKLTKKEIQFLELLLKNRYSVLSFEQIEQSIWDGNTTPDAMRMVVVTLRKKIYPELIENFKGIGYRLNILL